MVERLGEMRKGRRERIKKGSRERTEIERKVNETKEILHEKWNLLMRRASGYLIHPTHVW